LFDINDIPSRLIRDMNSLDQCEQLILRISGLGKKKIRTDNLILSAVLILLFEKNKQTHILFIKRSEKVSHHKGEISFPGGRMEPSDSSLKHTALRETEEEIGLPSDRIRIIAELDDYVTPYQFHITPYVGIVSPPFSTTINPDEVTEVIEVPLADLLNKHNYRTGYRLYHKTVYLVHFFSYREHTIWGITGFILHEFLHALINPISDAGT
jgi:8-oxo-dGTP pyrophosphatase MutT (NUDIX family)